jgi:hypothetical protein
MSTPENELLDLAHWRPFEYFIGGDPTRVVSMEVRRMNPTAAAPFKRALKKARDAYNGVLPRAELERLRKVAKAGAADLEALRASAEGDDEKLRACVALAESLIKEAQEMQRRDADAQGAFFEAFPEDVLRRTFERGVRKVSMTVDGRAITDSREMYENADEGLTIAVINKLERMCSLSESEGKASSSLSTSDAAPTAGNGDSPANSTESEGGPKPSTATETPSAN